MSERSYNLAEEFYRAILIPSIRYFDHFTFQRNVVGMHDSLVTFAINTQFVMKKEEEDEIMENIKKVKALIFDKAFSGRDVRVMPKMMRARYVRNCNAAIPIMLSTKAMIMRVLDRNNMLVPKMFVQKSGYDSIGEGGLN